MASAARTAIVRAVPMRAPAQIIVSPPRRRSRSTKATKKHHRRRHGVGGGAINQKTMMAAGIGGAVLGFVDKNFPQLPTIPLLGRAGSIAMVAYFLSGKSGGLGGIARDVALAGAAVAGYEMGKDGKVSGGEIMGEGIVPQVSGGRGILSNQV